MRSMKLVPYRDIEDKETVPLKVLHKRRSKKSYLLVATVLFLLLTSSASAVTGYWVYNMYKTYSLLAQNEMQHLRLAMTLLESLQSQPVTLEKLKQANQEFAEALNDAKVINTQLARFSGVVGSTPIYGPRFIAALHLSLLSMDISQAGVSSCTLGEIVLAHLDFSRSAATSGLTPADFATISSDYQMVKTSLNAAISEALQLTPADLSFDVHLAKLLQEFQTNIPLLRSMLTQIDQLLPVLPSLLGIATSAHYLIEILDSTELRPGGGFIGNYALATVSQGRLTDAHVTDTYILDHSFALTGHSIPFPSAYQWFASDLGVSNWGLRDSNLDADFPTDARYSELLYQREGGTVPLQGVVAITPFFVEQVLDATGPINMPEYNEVVTAQNLVSLIHLHQLGSTGVGSDLISSPDGYSSQRKYFTELLGERLLARLQVLPSAVLPVLVKDVVQAVQSKDVQIYFNSNEAESILLHNHLADTIASSNGDSLFVVDANVGGNKANNLITSTINDQVTIDRNGDAVHHTTLSYAWITPGDVYGSGLYADYVRVYVPTSSSLLSEQGWQSEGSSVQFSHNVWAGFFNLVYGQTRTIVLIWTDHSVAKSSTYKWHYYYLLQRQAGIQRTVALQIILPSCAVVANKEGGLFSQGNNVEKFTDPLIKDLNFEVDYACK